MMPRPLALLAVAALHGAALAALWPAPRGAAPAAPGAMAVRVLPLVVAQAAPPVPRRAAAPVWQPPALAVPTPLAFELQADTPAVAAPQRAAAAPPPPASVALVAAPRAEPVAPAEAAPALQSARRAACAPAPHPPLLRERGIEGVVRLRVWVDELGRAGQVLLAASSGWRLFDDAAVAQARRCPFHPALRGSEPVGSWVEFPVRFALETSSNG